MTSRRPRTAPGVSFATRLENLIDRHSVRLGAWLLRRTRGRVVRLWHRRALLLTTRGRRSGSPRTVVLQYFPDGRDMVVVAANSGMPTDPAWYLNLINDPRATVEVDGRTMPVRAIPMTHDEAAVWWPRVLQTAPNYARFPKRTDRPLALHLGRHAAHAALVGSSAPAQSSRYTNCRLLVNAVPRSACSASASATCSRTPPGALGEALRAGAGRGGAGHRRRSWCPSGQAEMVAIGKESV